jgi:hypothetical protein
MRGESPGYGYTDIDNLAYEKSKPRLHGLLTSMTTKEVDEKLSIHRSHLNSDTTISISHGSPTASTNAPPIVTAFVNCPL